jgi:hypothetical protein
MQQKTAKTPFKAELVSSTAPPNARGEANNDGADLSDSS